MSLFNQNHFYHMESFPRIYPAGQEVQSIGYMKAKKDWIKHSFASMNFSFILSGRGYYSSGGVLHPVQAPVVITQSPGVPMHYGPDRVWEELFFIFPASCHSWFETRGFLKTPFWKIHQTGDIITQIRDMFYNVSRNQIRSDQIDIAIQRLILDSRMESSLPRESPLQIFIHKLHREMEQDCTASFDFHALVRERGYSPSSFRRTWEKMFEVPPGQIQIEFRMRQACRMLAETDLPVKEIAGELGYSDPLYFSKLFKKKRTESPGQYRKRTREPYFSSHFGSR
ncbi:AraC family transcriptional regulator [Oceanispirochaeta sp.]|jgi:AraC-like DNA-binding protein|uniref:helix-turn-helix domain-containing protein n=1 Tax=Oceanispirochaeta sp. TaxID=2035350 RepID=UPI0026046E07|nr:AraC family transcriptional regulator [Oceanispirochaeta sp.]MDA3957652.1 AraC family transcriptional regulator [Oceanispirochaeta sp.]